MGCFPGLMDDLHIYRRVITKRVYDNGATMTSKMTFSGQTLISGNTNYCLIDQFDSDGSTRLNQQKIYYEGFAENSFFLLPTDYSPWKDGREFQSDSIAADGTTVLQRAARTWEQPIAGGSWPLTQPETNAAAKPNSPQTTQVITTLEPSHANKVSKQTFAYDKYTNRTDVYEYDFWNGSVFSLVRRTHTDYLLSSYDTLNPSSSNPDLSLTSHIRNLPTQTSVFDANSVERARTAIEYDNYVLDGPNCSQSFHCPLLARADISGLDSSFTAGYTKRGNPTAVTRYLLSGGTGSVSTYAHYDIAGNAVRSIDPRSTTANIIATSIEYDDRFGTPNNEARSNTAPTELAGLMSFAFPTKVINSLGHTSYAQFDYYLGKPVNGEDANGTVASGTFNNVLDRPTQIRRAIGTTAENQTTFSYDDGLRIVTTTSDLHANDDNVLLSKILYDQMGRTKETRQYEGSGNYIAVQTEYDSLGRPFKISNPFRPWWPGQTAVWTTQAFDALNRVISVMTPDNAVVTTNYSGNAVTVTDQAGKKRKSVTDALGRLIEVYEDPEVPGGPAELNFQTTYLYDALDNFVKVTQGSQQRFFMYDSLKRLIRARNPEQGTLGSLALSDPISGNSAWSIAYEYDSSGNLIKKTDARGVESIYAYDALNRNTTINYTDTPIAIDVKWFYDGASNGKGRFWHFYKGGDFSTGQEVEHTAVDSYDALGRPLVQRQLFKSGGVWSTTYHVERTYNRGGGVTSQKYPSQHSVTYNYDPAGRVADNGSNLAFKGNLGDGTERTYAAGIIYSQWGSLSREQYGTNTAVYHKLRYNIRGQLCDVRASNVNDDTAGELGALVNYYSNAWAHCGSGTDNNGNLLMSQTIINSYSMEDRYEYDQLNRLTAVNEWQNGSTHTGRQQYEYDRWGNRTINATGTWIGNSNNPPNPLLNEMQFDVGALASTNRLYAPGDVALPENQRRMRFDAAGNLTNDTYTGAGLREYDAENRMTRAWGGNNQSQYYTYNANGQRVRRKVDNQETWQIYGFDGELLAEYAANGAIASPQKEYGYRNGQLLITAESASPQSPPGVNVAAASNGAVATASSTYGPTAAASNAINSDHVGTAGWWADSTSSSYPDWLQVEFAGSKTISEIDVFGVQQNYGSPVEPTLTMTSSYALTNFEVQYWTGSAWATVPGGSVTGNEKVWRKFTFTPLTTSKIRVHVTNVAGDNHSQVVEIEAYGPGNVAAASSGAVATASSTYGPTAAASNAINGDHVGTAGWWADGTSSVYPDWIQVEFAGSKTISEIDVFGVQQNYGSPIEPTLTMTSSYALTNFEVQYWTGSAWATVPGGSVTGNDKVWRKFTFTPLTTSKIRVHVTNVAGDNHSQVVEIEAYAASSAASIQWLVTDHLGTPRIVIDETGTLANIKRHDYLPFGEELFAPTGGRSAALGYASGDGVRQQFTAQERDIETGLDYFNARYYASVQGRFTSPDVPLVDQSASDPQSWNLYSYVRNNPLGLTDPTGHSAQGICKEACQESRKRAEEARKQAEAEGIDVAVTDTNEIGVRTKLSIRLFTEAKGDLDEFLELEYIQDLEQTDVLAAGCYKRAKNSLPCAYEAGLLPITSATRLLRGAGPGVKLLGTARMNLLNAVKNSKLRNLINDLYRPAAKIGNGSTADAIRYERATGILLSPAGHSTKGLAYQAALQKLVRTGTLAPSDRAIAWQLINDLKDALK